MVSHPRILLSSVFGPYGVDDAYGRKENIMELFHNQVTREQGLFSFRFNHPSFGLSFIAENLLCHTTVLDFPSEKRFIREIRKDYDFVGISFIVPNFIKAKRMAQLVRMYAPKTKIILGGHGTAIQNIEKLILHDHICRGEGIRFLRELIGQDPKDPIVHGIHSASSEKYLMGVPLANDSAVLLPGVGCKNGCDFCCTSKFFGKKYIPFLKTGRELFEVCLRAEKERGITEFFVMDENFLKQRDRAEEFLAELERNNKHYLFSIFSSAETIKDVGIEFLKRMGVFWIWIGMEGKKSPYAKNHGVDFRQLVAELRANGISILGSVILFTEEHDKNSIYEDINFAIDVAPDFIQFMQLGPMPGTTLYEQYDKRGLLLKDVPFEEWHGQHQIWFKHPHFTAEESEIYLRKAFKLAYDKLGSSLLRVFETTLMGYLSTLNETRPSLVARNLYFKKLCAGYYPGLSVIINKTPNKKELLLAKKLKGRYEEAFGPMTPVQKIQSVIAHGLATIESFRIENKTDL
ncbi:MAG: cobalamin-dependent protein, partial [Pseudomonadota bacterium]